MAAFREDEGIYPLMVQLAACLCLEIDASGLPSPCWCGILPGSTTDADCGCDGEDDNCGGKAWVRLTSTFPSSSFPVPDQIEAKCNTTLAYVLEVGISRCTPVFEDENGAAPSVQQQLAAARLELADMAAMRRAIACCIKTADRSYLLGEYAPLAVGGGCGGGIWTVTIWGA